MFYYIGQSTDLLTQVQPGLSLDDGWNKLDNIWYKGYSTECVLQDNLSNIVSGFKPEGIWCAIQSLENEHKVFYPKVRCFPEFRTGNNISNLSGEEFIYSDSFELVAYDSHADVNKTVSRVTDYLLSNVKNFHRFNDREVSIWCTGGIDSTSIIALYEYAKIPYSVYVAKPKTAFKNLRDFEGSITEYTSTIALLLQEKHWGYELLSRFNEPKTLVTGFYGDEFVGRGPFQLCFIANSMGSNIADMISESQYMYAYMQRFLKKEKQPEIVLAELATKEKIISKIARDYQIWHLNNITTFCPYYDIRILNEVLSLRFDVLLDASLNATVQKEVINQTTPEVNMLVDTYKNTIDGRVNFFKNIDKVNLSYCKQIIEV